MIGTPCQEADNKCITRWGTSPSRDGVYRCWHHWKMLYYPDMPETVGKGVVVARSPRACLYDGPTCQGKASHRHMGGFVCDKHYADSERIRAEDEAHPRPPPKMIRYIPATYGKK